ncbi:uncharacterized protein [Hoplias malabaricus]|uniref:uncharacterized protein isoform X2 n=1 Tax=Hoplias malabaricus TaxID=27720 RepID=UPI003461EE6E
MVHPLVVVWFIMVSSASAYGNVVYIHRKTGSSVKLRCESSNDSERLKAFSLHRGPEKNHSEVLYLNIERSAYIHNPEDHHRISVQNELMNHSATVTITNLQQNDTNLYYCLFYKEGNGGMSDVPGRPKFFLHVEDDVYGGVVYIHRKTNASVELPCDCSNVGGELMAFSLHRGPKKTLSDVLYLPSDNHLSIHNPEDRHRISVQNQVENCRATVTITNLQQGDTDLYHCVFFKGEAGFPDVPLSKMFFLHVEDDEPEVCVCREYELWLYGVSTAAALLLLGVFVFAGELCKKAPVQPVYEDMRELPPSVRNPY